MAKDYKVVPFDPAKGQVKNNNRWDENQRFAVVSLDGEIIDDAQGYGYKTAQNAHIAFSYKHNKRDRSLDRHILKWMDEHKEFVDLMDYVGFEIEKGSFGPNAEFDTAKVKELLTGAELNPDFPARDLLRMWRKG